jgi:ribosome maturation factor RimP
MADGSRLEGKLESVSEGSIVLGVKGTEKEIRIDEIKKAKAIVTFN